MWCSTVASWHMHAQSIIGPGYVMTDETDPTTESARQVHVVRDGNEIY